MKYKYEIVGTNFLWVLILVKLGGPDAKIQNTLLGWIFFLIILKVDLKILPILFMSECISNVSENFKCGL